MYPDHTVTATTSTASLLRFRKSQLERAKKKKKKSGIDNGVSGSLQKNSSLSSCNRVPFSGRKATVHGSFSRRNCGRIFQTDIILPNAIGACVLRTCHPRHGPWRWFDDSMLDCCEPLEKIKSQGVTFGKVACLAVCNGAQVEPFRTDQSSLDDFRKRVISCTSSEDCHLIVSYNRAVFKQTGTGHFSPIGGYHAGKDMVLILDVARFKYPPHWVPLSLLWDAMNTIDKDTGHHRGLAFCRFMVISRLQKATSVLYTVSCRHEGWNAVAKYLTEDVPLLFTSKNLNDVDDVLCVVFRLAPSNLRDFIQWVAEVRRQDDGGTVLSEEEKGRLALKEEVLKQIRETELFKHVTRYLAFESSLCKNLAPSGYKDGLADIAANVCCQGAKLLTGKIRSANGLCCKDMIVKLLKAESKEAVTVVSGTVITDGTEQMVDMLIPSSQTEPSCFCDFDQNSCCGIHPSIGDGLTVLLFSLPQDTWLGLKEEKLQAEMKGLTSVDSLPTLLQEEVLHLQRQLSFVKADLNMPPSSS
ncbi:glutathione gamma-glutamylcysteinyltransferase 3-like isoform X4 [Durio zibethinus]|uniref:glutathione gamma-glutamylcysteinyltransferase n=1 Tax=Durio zibethinus TaxID=66656 RepID=A0A6P6A161_DURZI|nr:glutathione gamma-glutamylcysteinyltransferase 3-like isoform X4 [Durio zibethinus]